MIRYIHGQYQIQKHIEIKAPIILPEVMVRTGSSINLIIVIYENEIYVADK